MIELPLGMDRERRRLLLVERAQAHPVPADALEAHRLADDLDGSVSSRKASWRATKTPSDPQKDQCGRLGIEIPDGARRGAVSDMISTYYATKLFDPRR